MSARRINNSRYTVKPWLKQQPETHSNFTTDPNAELQPASLLCLGHIFPLSATDLNVKLLHLSLEGARIGGTSQNLDRLLRDALTQSSKVIPDNPAPILEDRTTAEITQPLTEEALQQHNRAFTGFTDCESDGFLSYSGGPSSLRSYYFVPHSEVATIALGDNSIPTTHEYVHINSASLLESLKKFFSTSPLLEAYWTGGVVDNNQMLHTPYYFFYHVGDQLKAFSSSLGDGTLEAELATFIEYLSAQSVHIGDVMARSIDSRQIYLKHLPFLFAPGTLLVTESDGIHTVVRQKSAVNVQTTSRESKSRPSLESSDDISDVCCSLEVSEIRFDGRFWAKTTPLQIRVSAIRNELISFNELDHFPLELAPEAVRTQLIERGRKFFDCRSGLYVTCNANVNEVGMGDCVRYMVDADAYRIVHESGDRVQHPIDRREGTEELLPGDDPEDPFLLQLPPRIQGFNMQDKTWVSLLTAGIEPVVWDKAAFENLAIEKDTKELIQALIRNKIKSDQSIDFVKGKGTGLIVLLHGGPGTGKTLTAETVAEIAEKPLYRITCGAMGTTATEVEKNLESVFHLGRRWGCVVLLDEADVFLEQRSLSDLARNALVSVFLRVIEYFDGIMILTSNRVATFDEAFKSRIQLALHYQALDEGQRRQVWQSFVRNLESVDEPVAIDDIKSRIVELSKYSMNGRQIRNVINTARQLARFKEEPLDFEHLKRVIKG
jgi:hypothetical protein